VVSSEAHGTFWRPDDPARRASGNLTIPDIGSAQLEMLDPFDVDPLTPGPVDRRVPLLHGRVARLGEVTIVNGFWTQYQFNATHNQTMRVGWLVVGDHMPDPDADVIRRVEARFPALEAVLGPQPIGWPTLPHAPGATSITFPIDDKRISWDTGGVRVVWQYEWSCNVTDTSAAVNMSPRVAFSSPDPHPIEWWIDNWLAPTNHLLAILSGAPSNPLDVELWAHEDPTTEEREDRLRLHGKGIGNNGEELEMRAVLARAPAIDLNAGGVHDVLRRLIELGDRQEVFFSLLSDSIRYRERPRRNRYLDLTAALEAYHGVENGPGPLEEDDFKKQKKQVLEEAKPHLGPQIFKFLKRWFPGRSNFSLEKKIQDLASSVGLGAEWNLDPQAMAKLRNDIAHGNTGLSAQRIKSAHDQAFDVARRLVLRDLGMVEPPAPTDPTSAAPEDGVDQP
jgi:hypothetical protein